MAAFAPAGTTERSPCTDPASGNRRAGGGQSHTGTGHTVVTQTLAGIPFLTGILDILIRTISPS